MHKNIIMENSKNIHVFDNVIEPAVQLKMYAYVKTSFFKIIGYDNIISLLKS